MKMVLGFVASAALALVLGGCGSSSDDGGAGSLGGDPDIGAVQARFDKPDGTFSAANASQVLDRGSEGSSSASELSFGAPTGGSSTTKKSVGLHVLDATSGRSSPFSCSPFTSGQQTGSCTCPNGGSVDYAIRSDNQGATRSAIMKIRLNSCGTEDSLIDGSEYLDIRTDTSNQQKPEFSMLLLVDATVTKAGVSKHIDIQSRFSNGAAEIAVKVDDGWVVVSIKSNGADGGSWTVRDKNGSWTCIVDDGHGTCTSDKGEKRSF